MDAFRDLSDDIRRNIGAILLSAMTIVYQLYERRKQHGRSQVRRILCSICSSVCSFVCVCAELNVCFCVQDAGVESVLSRLRGHADSIMTFAGMISYRVATDVNSRLMRMNVLMNH